MPRYFEYIPTLALSALSGLNFRLFLDAATTGQAIVSLLVSLWCLGIAYITFPDKD